MIVINGTFDDGSTSKGTVDKTYDEIKDIVENGI